MNLKFIKTYQSTLWCYIIFNESQLPPSEALLPASDGECLLLWNLPEPDRILSDPILFALKCIFLPAAFLMYAQSASQEIKALILTLLFLFIYFRGTTTTHLMQHNSPAQ